MTEVMALFNTSELFMMGGDEVPHDCWASNSEVLSFVKAKGWGSDMEKLENYHAERIIAILAAQNRSVMCWQEVFESGAALDADSLVNVWSGGWEWCGYMRFGHVFCTALRHAPEIVSSLPALCSGWLRLHACRCEKPTSGSTAVRDNTTCSYEYGAGGPWFGKMHVRDDSWTHTISKVAAAGHRAVLSSPFYLNAENSGSNFDEVWPWYYTVEPTAFQANHSATGLPLTPHEREASVEGVEACMWSEWVSHENFMTRFWPSAAAVAERGWSPQDANSIDDFRRRIHAFACQLQARGLPAAPAVFGGGFFHPNGTVCSSRGISVLGPPGEGCLPRYSSCDAV